MNKCQFKISIFLKGYSFGIKTKEEGISPTWAQRNPVGRWRRGLRKSTAFLRRSPQGRLAGKHIEEMLHYITLFQRLTMYIDTVAKVLWVLKICVRPFSWEFHKNVSPRTFMSSGDPVNHTFKKSLSTLHCKRIKCGFVFFYQSDSINLEFENIQHRPG